LLTIIFGSDYLEICECSIKLINNSKVSPLCP
jgi:hypothetical protein